MIEIPASLAERFKARQVVLVAGLGCAELAGAPGWNELALRLADFVDDDARKMELKELVALGRRDAAIGYLASRLPKQAITRVLKDAYPVRSEAPRVIGALARLPWRGVIATGWDGLWAAAASRDNEESDVRVFWPNEAAALAKFRGRFLWQISGVTSIPESLGLGAEGARRLASTGVAATLRTLAEKRSLLFVGFKPGDPDLRLITEQLAGVLGGGPHFLLVAGRRDLETEVVEAELGTVTVTYEGTMDGALKGLQVALGQLAAQASPPEDDIETWLEIWKRDPTDPEPRAVLERVETRLRSERNWQRLVELLLGRVETGSDRAERVTMLREVARVYDGPIHSPEHAFAALSTAFRLDADAEGLLGEVERAAGKSGRWHELAAIYAPVCAELEDRPTEAAHRIALARIYAEELNLPDEALAQYRAVMARDPENPRAARSRADLLARNGRWAELGPALAQAAELEPDAMQARELRLRLAELKATRLSDTEGAIETFERVLADDLAAGASPFPAEALDALERMYRKAERWADLARILGEKSAHAGDPTEAARVRRERAEIFAERLADVAASIRDLEAVVEKDPKDRAALRTLETLYEKQGRDADYLRTVERLAALAESEGERVLLLRRLAAEWEAKPEGIERSVKALDQLLAIEPRDGDAFRALVRVLRHGKRWTVLVQALTRQIDFTDNPVAKGELWATLGEVYERELSDAEHAVTAYGNAVSLGDERDATLGALARLEEKARHWTAAIEALDKLAQNAPKPNRHDALARAAEITAEHLGDREAARIRFGRVLEADPVNARALIGMSGSYRAQGESRRAVDLLREAEPRVSIRVDKARVLFELGLLYQDELDDTDKATEALTRALENDPEHVPAAERLVLLQARAERWLALEPILEMLARKAGTGEQAEKAVDLYVRLGETAERLGNLDAAKHSFEIAHRLAPKALPVLRGLGELHLQRGEWREAMGLYEALLERHGPSLPPEGLIDVYGRLGRCQAALGDRQASLAWHEKAFALNGLHRPTLEAMAALHAEKGDFAALVLDKRALLGLATDDETRARLSAEIGDLYLDKLGDPSHAITAYRAVLAHSPGNRAILNRLLELYTGEKRWREAARMLIRLADIEETPEVRARHLYRAADIHHDQLGDVDWAVALFNRALDHAPDLPGAFDTIERLLTEAGAWKELARNYRKMIKRLPTEGQPELRLRLWNGLADVSLGHLGDLEMATTAMEVASGLDPGNVQRHEQLADVFFKAGPDHFDKAIAEHQWLIANNPDRLQSYRALAELYAESGALDKLWCVAATLVFLRKADPELQRFYDQHRPQELRPARRAFGGDVWDRVVHPDEDPFIAAMFVLMGQFVAESFAKQHQTIGLRRRERIDLDKDDRLATRVLRYVAETLELQAPDLFFKQSEPYSLSLYNLQQRGVLTPALVIGRGIEQRATEADLVFEMGKRLAFLRPERFVRFATPSPSSLDIAVRAMLMLAGSLVGSGPHNGEVDRLTAELRRQVPHPVTERLLVVGRKLVSERGSMIDVQGWMTAADLTAARVGFTLTSDLGAAARVLSTEPAGMSPLNAKERLRDLLAYSVSEQYFAVRKLLGLDLM